MTVKLVKWYFNLKSWTPVKSQWIQLMSYVPIDERENINKFVHRVDSEAALIGRALILKFLSHVLDVPSDKLKLTRTHKGRPILQKEYKEEIKCPVILDFNISHSGDYCILGGVWGDTEKVDIAIGVDVTKIVRKESHDLKRFLHLMSKREFLPNEWKMVEESSSDKLKCVNFTRLWCLKESLIKANGLGLSFGLARIEFYCKEPFKVGNLPIDRIQIDTQVKLDGLFVENWLFLESALDSGHLAAIALAKNQHHAISRDTPLVEISDAELKKPFSEVSMDDLLSTLIPRHDPIEDDWIDYLEKELRKQS